MTTRVLHETQQLLRLRRLREQAARAEVQRCRLHQQTQQRVVDVRLQQLSELRAALSCLFDWTKAIDAAELPRLVRFASARREALDDALERAEFELIDERSALDQATRDLDDAVACWRRAQGRSEAVSRLHDDARRAMARDAELRLEADLDGSNRRGT